MSVLAADPDAVARLLQARPHPVAAVVIGGSAGGWTALADLLAGLPGDFPLPVAIVLHLHPDQDDTLAGYFDRHCALGVKLAQDKDPVAPGEATFAPPDYHLLIEWDHTYALSADAKVAYSRPSIDVLFESAAAVYGPQLAGILLTGASRDGTEGLRRIKELGGLTVVQDPETAEFPLMPRSALENADPALVLTLEGIGALLAQLAASGRTQPPTDPNSPDEPNRSPFSPDRTYS